MDRFWYCDAVFDPVETVRRHADPEPEAMPDHYLSYFGVKIASTFFPSLLPPGGVEIETLPANWHADLAEFAAALRAVDLADTSFAMAELGCGWGCWMNLTGVVARRAGRTVRLAGVEGDATHVGYARQALADNGFSAGDYMLFHGIAAGRRGTALFPLNQGNEWGLKPVFGANWLQRAAARRRGGFQALPMITLDQIIGGGRLDLLHMDIQGGEGDLIASSLDILTAQVAYMVIGTHSREIEGRLFDRLMGNGWRLEIDRPATYHLSRPTPCISIDGVQGWRNMKLLPEAAAL